MTLKILNLYAGIGGNRKLWPNDDIEVTAVELNPEIAKIYRDFFPMDKVIVADAHQYLLEHYQEFDFIWSSPPCVTHSRINKNFGNIRYADMSLYQEIIFVKNWFKGKFCVENVIPYYKPLIPAQQIDRHYYWCNFKISQRIIRNPPKEIVMVSKNQSTKKQYILNYTKLKNKKPIFDLCHTDCSSTMKTQLLNNCVKPEIGLHIFNMAFKEKQQTLDNQKPKDPHKP